MNDAGRFNPFPGLRSFEEHEDHLFFGRERDLDELLRRLRTTRFLAVLGTSGSGKSSLVKSGLIPSLYAGFMSRAGSAWRIATMRPGEDPIGHLAEALDAIAGAGESDDAEFHRAIVEATLRRGDLGLVKALDEARLDPHDRVLVVVDQFEELFRFKRSRKIRGSRDEAVAFVQLLLEATRQEPVPIYVVITMRSDFIGNCTEIPGLTETINRGQYLVPLMNREQRRAAIEGPVAVGGGEISPRLLLRLLNDVGDDPDQLPIMQHALMRTWDAWEHDHERSEPLDLRHYEAIGTMQEALDRHAEEAYAELGSERRRKIAERLFKSLTEKAPNALQGVRRPSRLEEICAVAGAEPHEVIGVVDVFRQPGRTFLMPPVEVELAADSVIDVSHESLMRVWGRLIRWVEEETEAAGFYRRLSEAARHHAEGAGALWRDPELTLGLQWREKHLPTAAWGERYDAHFERSIAFLDASLREHERQRAAEERERQRKLRLTRLVAIVLGVGAVVTLAFGVYAMILKGEADRQREAAEEQRRIADEERHEADRQREEAQRERAEAERQRAAAEEQKRAALEARQVADQQREIAVEQEAIAQRNERQAREEQQRADQAARKAEQERARAEQESARAEQERARAEQQRDKAETAEEEARRLQRIAEAKNLAIQTLGLQEEGQRQLAALLALAAYRLHHRAGGEAADPDVFNALHQTLERLGTEDRRQIPHRHRGAVRALAITPDARTLASGGDEGEIRLTDLDRPDAEAAALASLGSGIRSLAIDAGGRWLAAGTRGGAVRVWDLEQRADERVLAAEGAVVSALAFRPATPALAAGSADGQVRIWDLAAASAEPRVLAAGEAAGAVSALAFSPDGKTLAAATGRGLLLWDPDRPQAPRSLGGGTEVRSVAVSRDGRYLAAGTASGRIDLRDLRQVDAPPAALAGHEARVEALDFHPRRNTLASASLDGSVRLWDAERPDVLPVVLRADVWVWSVVFGPAGERMVSGSGDGTLHLWTTSIELLAAEVCRRVDRDLTAAEWEKYLPADAEHEATCPGS